MILEIHTWILEIHTNTRKDKRKVESCSNNRKTHATVTMNFILFIFFYLWILFYLLILSYLQEELRVAPKLRESSACAFSLHQVFPENHLTLSCSVSSASILFSQAYVATIKTALLMRHKRICKLRNPGSRKGKILQPLHVLV